MHLRKTAKNIAMVVAVAAALVFVFAVVFLTNALV